MSIPILTRIILDLGPEGSDYLIEREVRWIADPTDPDDQRAIWRLAAMALGATEEEALHADFHRRELTLIGASDPCKEWRLDVREWCAIRTLVTLHLVGCDEAHATAALCAKVWGGPCPSTAATGEADRVPRWCVEANRPRRPGDLSMTRDERRRHINNICRAHADACRAGDREGAAILARWADRHVELDQKPNSPPTPEVKP